MGEFFINGRGPLLFKIYRLLVYVDYIFCFSPLQWLVLVFLLEVGNFELDLKSYLFIILDYYFVVSTIILLLSYVWWKVCRWMAWSGMLVLVVKCVGNFSLPEGDLIVLFFAL